MTHSLNRQPAKNGEMQSTRIFEKLAVFSCSQKIRNWPLPKRWPMAAWMLKNNSQGPILGWL